MIEDWDHSAAAWLADMGETGDFARAQVLDAPMRARVAASGAANALDVGCGEGRFCRIMDAMGVAATGLDPTRALIRAAQRRGGATYLQGRAEAIPRPDTSFDLVVSYLSLADIPDLDAAYAEMCRVLRPGGRLLIANLSSFATALPDGAGPEGWLARGRDGAFACDRYHEPREIRVGWRGIRVRNYHRPMQAYMAPLVEAGLHLTHYAEPRPDRDAGPRAAPFLRAPLFVVMEWQKPGP